MTLARTQKKEMTFEASMERLEQIVRLMEQGDAPLDESLKLFEEGTELIRKCGAMLDEAQSRVTMITPGANGTPEETEFTDEE